MSEYPTLYIIPSENFEAMFPAHAGMSRSVL